jgi:hypothetical protein
MPQCIYLPSTFLLLSVFPGHHIGTSPLLLEHFPLPGEFSSLTFNIFCWQGLMQITRSSCYRVNGEVAQPLGMTGHLVPKYSVKCLWAKKLNCPIWIPGSCLLLFVWPKRLSLLLICWMETMMSPPLHIAIYRCYSSKCFQNCNMLCIHVRLLSLPSFLKSLQPSPGKALS